LSFPVYQPHQFRGMLELASVSQFLPKRSNVDRAKSRSTQGRANRNRSRLSNNRATRSTVNGTFIFGHQIEQLDRLYVYRDRGKVVNFLQENPSLFRLLRDVYHKAQEYFGAGVEVILDVLTDYEVPTHRELVALVQTPLPVGEALDRLDRLYQEWWTKASVVEPLKMSIDVESV
jgi:hypothetical protein